MSFCMPLKLSASFYNTYTQHTDFLFGSNLVSLQGIQTINFRFFHSIFTPQELKMGGFEL